MATLPDQPFDIREQLARIDKMRAETDKNHIELQKIIAKTLKVQRDAAKVEQESRLAPYTLVFTGLGAGAALVAAGASLAKLLIG